VDKSAEEKPLATPQGPGGDVYVRPAPSKKKKRKKSDKKMELDDLKREVEMVSTWAVFVHCENHKSLLRISILVCILPLI